MNRTNHKRKATNKELIDSYTELKNVWKVAEKHGMCGQSVHERLVKLNVKLRNQKITEEESRVIRAVYESGIKKGDGKLDALSNRIGRTKQWISRKAGEMGLTSYKRKHTDDLKSTNSICVKKRIKERGHPKGMKGKKHSKEVKDLLSKKSKAITDSYSEVDWYLRAKKSHKTVKKNRKKGAAINRGAKTTWKAQWQIIGGSRNFYRSQWEVDYAKYLEFLKGKKKIKDWKHEPDTFWFESIKRGVRSYLPDFKVTYNNGDVEYHEVKGWMDDKSKTKIKRMAKYHPTVKLILIREPEIKKIRKEFAFLLK